MEHTFVGTQTPAQSQNLKALEEARLRASTVHRARNIGAEATDITQQAAAALLRGGALQAPQVSVNTFDLYLKVCNWFNSFWLFYVKFNWWLKYSLSKLKQT